MNHPPTPPSTKQKMAQPTPYRRELREIRRENLNEILAEHEDRTRLALLLNVSQSRITHITRSTGTAFRPINEVLARRIEELLGLPAFTLDRDTNLKLLAASSRAVHEARDRFQGATLAPRHGQGNNHDGPHPQPAARPGRSRLRGHAGQAGEVTQRPIAALCV
jgi:hypothetical protein